MTYWHTSRDAPPPGRVAVVLGVEGTVLQLILDGPPPPTSGTADWVAEVSAVTNRGVPLRRLTLDGVPTGGPGGRYLWVAVFDLPPPGSEVLRLQARIGAEPELSVWLYQTWTLIKP